MRIDGPKREHFHLFCQLDYDALDENGNAVGKPCPVIVDAMARDHNTYEKFAITYRSGVALRAITIWLKMLRDTP